MKPILEHLPLESEESFVVKQFEYKFYPTPWHFHPEYELVLVSESNGKRFIGDSITNFKANDLTLIGPNLPHLYKNDPAYYAPHSKLRAKSIVVHFSQDSFGENFMSLPETKKIRTLLARSARGLDIYGSTRKTIIDKLNELCTLKGLSRWLMLLEILNILSHSKELKFVSKESIIGQNETESDRINKVFNFVLQNYPREIAVAEIAGLVNLTVNSFSRFFSQRTRKTFIGFLIEVRLNHASKMLIETDTSIVEICYACGFNNLSNFNRQFKSMYGISPSSYRKNYWEKFK
jgi:AraC-like DNA-binding protein